MGKKVKEVGEGKKFKLYINIVTILMLLCIIIIIVLFVTSLNSKINSSGWQSQYTLELPEPKQVTTTGKTKLKTNIRNYEINYLAKYEISGLVINMKKYLTNDLSQKDVALTWGKLSNRKNAAKIKTSYKPRVLHFSYDNDFAYELGSDYIDSHISNNHLIPASKAVKEKISQIGFGDFITITGYLVSVEKNGEEIWRSSLSRTDGGTGEYGTGACEVIYVREITWIDE